MILPLVTSPILARTLGVNGVGVYAYLSTVTGYFSIVADMGVYRYGIREISSVKNNKNDLSKVFSEIWFIHTVLFLVTGIAFFIYCYCFSEYPYYMRIFLLMYLGDYLKINWLFTGVEDFKRITIIDTVIKVCSFLAICLFIRKSSDINLYIFIMSISSLISSLIYWVLSPRYVKLVKIDYKNSLKRFKYILILFIPVLMENIYTNMDRLMLGAMSSIDQVGYYDNATKALISNRIICAISLVIMPQMTFLLKKGDSKSAETLMSRSVDISMLLSSAFAFGTAAIASTFSVVFWGDEFASCGRLISCLVIAMPAMAISRIIREGYLISAGKDGKYFLASASGAISNMLLNAILIPRFHAIGASIATVCSEYIVLFMQVYVIRNDIDMMRMINKGIPYYIIGFVMYVTIRYFQLFYSMTYIFELLFSIVLGVLVYGGLCMVWWKANKETYYLGLINRLIGGRK